MAERSNWKRNILVYKIDSLINWFFIPIGVYILIWNKDLKLNFSQINSAISIGLIWSVILELPSGALADLIGRKKTIIIGRIFLVIAYVAFALQHNWLGIMLHQIFYYTDQAMNSGAQSALLFDSLKENEKEKEYYKKVEADSFFLNTVGMGVASIISGLLYKINSFLPFTIMIPITITGAVMSFFYTEPKIDSQKYSLKAYLRQNVDGMKHIVRNSKIKWISIFSIITMTITYVSLWYIYEPRITVAFDNPILITWLIGGTYIIRAVGIKFINVLDKKIDQKRAPVFIAFLQSIGSMLSFIKNGFGAISSVYLRKFSDGYIRPTVLNLQNENIESRYRATSLSAISLFYNILVSVIGVFIGFVMDKLGPATTLGLVGTVGLIVGLPVAFKLSTVLSKE